MPCSPVDVHITPQNTVVFTKFWDHSSIEIQKWNLRPVLLYSTVLEVCAHTFLVIAAARVLQGKVALVTGASSGIGTAICEHLAAAGAKVALAARREDRLKYLEAQIARQGGTALAVAMDVCNEQQV
jgi:3-oxoacyl-ACP reductase-like protein